MRRRAVPEHPKPGDGLPYTDQVLRPRLFVCLALLACFACDHGVTPPRSRSSAIVNGAAESGFDAVGALVWAAPLDYRGAFCTAALIDPQWVLTAAHCLVEQEGLVVRPQVVSFMVGTDARGFGGPDAGTLYAAASFHLHPDYETVYDRSDIALVRLAQPVHDVVPLTVNASMLQVVGEGATYVGFGATEGLTKTGGGLKRSTQVPFSAVVGDVYFSEYNGSSVCFGDSGGPALMDVAGQLRVVGVNSAVGGCNPDADPDCPADPCQRGMVITRTDVFASWVAEELGAPPPDCRVDGSVCVCGAACTADGSCDNGVCQTDDCEAIYACLRACSDEDPNCGVGCYDRGTDQGQAALDAMTACFSDECGGLGEADFSQCALARCESQVSDCLPGQTGPLSCEQVQDCALQCPAGDEGCVQQCLFDGTAADQGRWLALNNCLLDRCSEADSVSVCAAESCADEVDACLPPSNCSVVGGECESGTACAPRAPSGTDCFASRGGQRGDACESGGSPLGCADGLYCVQGTCRQMCVVDVHCVAGEACNRPLFVGTDIGVCLAADEPEPPVEQPVEMEPSDDMVAPMVPSDGGDTPDGGSAAVGDVGDSAVDGMSGGTDAGADPPSPGSGSGGCRLSLAGRGPDRYAGWFTAVALLWLASRRRNW